MNTEKLPLVTVICNCYNHELYVWEALESVVKQSYTNIELIVINNGSSDYSFDVIQKFVLQYPETVFINLPTTISHNKAFNLAFKKSKGNFLIDLSGDDRLLPDCIEKHVYFFASQDENVGLIFGNANNIDLNGKFINHYFAVNEMGKVLDQNLFTTSYESLLNGGLCMCSVSAMMRRKHFELLNGYNENLVFEDLDYWLRLSYRHRIAFLDHFLVEKRNLGGSLGNQLHQKNNFAKKINHSLMMIYTEAIKRNSSKENKALLKRIHYSIEQCYLNNNWLDFLKFFLLELKCKISIYFK